MQHLRWNSQSPSKTQFIKTDTEEIGNGSSPIYFKNWFDNNKIFPQRKLNAQKLSPVNSNKYIKKEVITVFKNLLENREERETP